MNKPALASRTSVIAALCAAAAIAEFPSTMYIPAIPDMARDFGVPVGRIQLTITAFAIGFCVGTLGAGPLSDRYGRKPALLAGVLLCLFATTLCALAQHVEVLLIGRVLQAIGTSTLYVVSRAAVRDMFDRLQTARAISLMAVGSTLMGMSSPIIGGYLHSFFGWRFVFGTVAAGATLTTVVLWRVLPVITADTPTTGLIRGMLASYAALLKNLRVMGYALAVANGGMCLFGFLTAAPIIVIELGGASPSQFGYYASLLPVGYVFGAFISNRLALRVDPDWIILSGGGMVLMGGALLALISNSTQPLTLVGPAMLVGFGNGLVSPTGNAGGISVMPRLAGAAAGLIGFFNMGAGALISALLSVIVIRSAAPLSAIWISAGCMVFCGIALARWQRAR